MLTLVLFMASLVTQPALSLAGNWEGILEAPRRPVVLTLRIEREGAGWRGSLRISGQQPIPLTEVTFEDGHLRFAAGNPPFEVRASVEEQVMTGTLVDSGESFPFRLEREPDLPQPANRLEAWQQDLDVVERKLPRYDRSLSAEEARRFRETVGALRQTLGKKSDAEIVVGLARAVALAENAHTRLYILRNRTELRRLPIRLWWFADGLRVVKATPAHRDLVGCSVERIGEHSPGRVREAVAPLFAGNGSWREYMSVYSLTSPEALFGLGLVADMEKVPWEFHCGDRSVRATLEPLPLARSASPTEAWWDLTPARQPTANQEWASAPVASPLPLYLRHPDSFYWHEYLPEAQALYVNYSRSQRMPSGPALEEFTQRIAEDVRDKPLKRVVIDLRFNTGGDLGLGRPVMEGLHALAEAKGARVAVISGRATFSAGLFHLVQWKSWGATIVGEPAGDELDFWSEGGNIILPNSKLYVHYANGFHTYSRKDYPEFKPYFGDLDVDTVAPNVLVLMTWDEYVRGEDPALQKALEDQIN